MGNESYKEDGRPSQQWYWADWFSEFGLRLCSLAARGLWIDMLGIMWQAEIRGTLTVNGNKLDNKAIAKLTGDTEENISKYLTELEDHDVFSRLENGTIISRRLYRDSKKKEQISRIRAKAGKKGMAKRWITKPQKPNNKSHNKTITKITASTSSSTSTVKNKERNNKERKTNVRKNEKNRFSDAMIFLTDLLIEGILKNDPKAKVPKKETPQYEKWINSIRLAYEADNRTLAEIKQAIIFSQNDEFWRSNILSAAKLRAQIPKLLLANKREDKFAGEDKRIGENRSPDQTRIPGKLWDKAAAIIVDKFWKKYGEQLEQARNKGDNEAVAVLRNRADQQLSRFLASSQELMRDPEKGAIIRELKHGEDLIFYVNEQKQEAING